MRLILPLMLLSTMMGRAQQADSTVVRDRSITVSLGHSLDQNVGLYYSNPKYNSESEAMDFAMDLSLWSLQVAFRHRALHQQLSLAHKVANTFEYSETTISKPTTRYVSYRIWYDLLYKRKFPFKPLLGLELAYANVSNDYGINYTWGGGSAWITDFTDKSERFMVQAPLGLFYARKGLFLSAVYQLPIHTWLNGSYWRRTTRREFGEQDIVNVKNESYSATHSSDVIAKQDGMLIFQLGFYWELK